MRRLLSVILSVTMIIGILALPASVSTVKAATTWYVDPLGTDDAGHGTGPGASAFKTIQYAVNSASSGDTIRVAAGTYEEFVEINKSLTLIGSGISSKILKPAGQFRYYKIPESGNTFIPVVIAFGGSATGSGTSTSDPRIISGSETIALTFRNFAIDGGGVVYDCNGSNAASGLFLRNVTGTITGNNVANLMPLPAGGNYEACIEVWGNSNLTISYNSLTLFGRQAILVNGDAGSYPDPVCTATCNTINGVETLLTNGIEFVCGATGTISYNTVSGVGSNAEGWGGCGILIYGSDDVVVRYNTVFNNEVGIAVAGYEKYMNAPARNNTIEYNNLFNNQWAIDVEAKALNTTVQFNTIEGSIYNAITVYAYSKDPGDWETGVPDGVLIKGNTINNVNGASWGIDVYLDADNVAIEGNTISGGAVGVGLELKGTISATRSVTIGGSPDKANHFSGQSKYALSLGPYTYNSLTYQWVSDLVAGCNDWGVYTESDIDGVIKDNEDDSTSTLGKVWFYPYWNDTTGEWDGLITYPVGGETLTSGSSVNITYRPQGLLSGKIRVLFYNGSYWAQIANNLPLTQTSYSWTVPEVSSNNCKIRVDNYDPATNASIVHDTSPPFTIGYAPPSKFFKTTYPLGNEIFLPTDTIHVTWDVEGFTGTEGKVRVLFYNGSYWTIEVQNLDLADGSFDINLSTKTIIDPLRVRVRVGIYDPATGAWLTWGTGKQYYDESGHFWVY